MSIECFNSVGSINHYYFIYNDGYIVNTNIARCLDIYSCYRVCGVFHIWGHINKYLITLGILLTSKTKNYLKKRINFIIFILHSVSKISILSNLSLDYYELKVEILLLAIILIIIYVGFIIYIPT